MDTTTSNTVLDCESIWSNIYEITDFIGAVLGILVALTTLIIFFKTYITRNVKFLSWMNGYSIYDGYQLGVIIQSKCLSTLSIQKVIFIIDDVEIILNEAQLFLPKQDENVIVLKPFQTVNIFSQGSSIPLFDDELLFCHKKIALKLVFCDGETKTIKYKFKKKKKNLTNSNAKRPYSEYIKGILVTNHLKYVVEETTENGNKNIYAIYIDGHLKNEFYGIKNIPLNSMGKKENIESFFKLKMNDKNINSVITVYENDFNKTIKKI